MCGDDVDRNVLCEMFGLISKIFRISCSYINQHILSSLSRWQKGFSCFPSHPPSIRWKTSQQASQYKTKSVLCFIVGIPVGAWRKSQCQMIVISPTCNPRNVTGDFPPPIYETLCRFQQKNQNRRNQVLGNQTP